MSSVRLKFFVPPAVPQNILFFLLEETDPSASVIVLAAVHPKDRKKNLVSGWKILVMVFEFYVLCVHFQVEGPKYLKFHGSLHLMHQSSLSIADNFFLSPETARHHQCQVRGKVWKEVVVFRDLRAVQIFKIDSYGHQHYRRNSGVRC